MKNPVLTMAILSVLAGCGGASFAPSLRDAPGRDHGFASSAEDDSAERAPANPGYPSPVNAFGAEVSHNGYWRLLRENDIVPLPDGGGAIASYLARDCEPGAPSEELTYAQCAARIMFFQTGANSPMETVRDLRNMVEETDFLSELIVPERGEGASFSYAEEGMRGIVWGLLTDPDDRDSGIVIAGEWPAGPRVNLMEMQFGEIARSVRLTEDARGTIGADDLQILQEP